VHRRVYDRPYGPALGVDDVQAGGASPQKTLRRQPNPTIPFAAEQLRAPPPADGRPVTNAIARIDGVRTAMWVEAKPAPSWFGGTRRAPLFRR